MKNYYFTFGVGQSILKHYYVKIEAENEDIARDIMFSNFGNKWCWCYNEEDWTKGDFVNKYNYKELKY